MKMQAGNLHVGEGAQGTDDFGKRAVFIAVAEASAFLLHQNFLRAEGSDVAVDPKPYGKGPVGEAGGKLRKPCRFLAGIQIHQAASQKDVGENLFFLDRPVIDNLIVRKAQPLYQPVFRSGDDFRIKTLLLHVAEEPGKGIGFDGIAHDPVSPVVGQGLF